MVQEQIAAVSGQKIRYLTAGSGWPVVLVHGFPLSADMWRDQLERVPDGFRLVAPDLRGFGRSPSSASPAGPRNMDDYAGDLEALLDALEIERAVIGGLSMGGYVTFALFRRAPERFSGTILSDTRPQPDTPEGRQARRALSELARSKGPAAVAEQMLHKVLGRTTKAERPEVVDAARRLMMSNPTEAIEGAIQAMIERPDSTADLARIRVPALVIVGEEDEVTPPADAEAMHAALARSRLVVISRAGHLSNLEAPDEFSRALEDFLTSNL